MATLAWETPIGPLTIAVRPRGDVSRLLFGKSGPTEPSPNWSETERAVIEKMQGLIDRYLGGEKVEFDVPIHQEGSPFQLQVWRELLTIPYGQTRSYGEIASRLGGNEIARAVGRACGENRIVIVVPCHRVIGSAGRLTGFGGGLELKDRLLRLEQGCSKTLFDD
ncbi:MAG: Methylated-DNA--protein-cysteine methyltransferase [Fimbriimonadaceae bacterium]|nr:Methylated-DNA--protein-cysteine methyltransferase [Fimbriimonadaceae bacterium]